MQQIPALFTESSFSLDEVFTAAVKQKSVYFSLRFQLSCPKNERHFLPAFIPERRQ